jgi:hypothetical protein
MNDLLCYPTDYACEDYATETRLSRLWVIEHRWLALAYRVVGLAIMATAGTGMLAFAWKAAGWVLAWR